MLEIGKIVNTHGLRGEVKIVPWTDYPDDFERIKNVCIKMRDKSMDCTIKSVKYQKNNIIVGFKEIKDINEAELWKNAVVYASREELGDLPEGVYYVADLIGMQVYDNDNNETIGEIADVLKTGSNDVYVVKRADKKDLLLPVIDDVVLDVDTEKRIVSVHIMEGLDEI